MPRTKLGAISPADLVTIEDAAITLGKNFSKRSIRRLIQSGEWTEGVHWVNQARLGATKRRVKIVLPAALKYAGISAGFR